MFKMKKISMTFCICFLSAAPLRAERPDVAWQIGGHSFRVFGIAYSPDGLLAASGSDDGTLKIWDVATGGLVLSLTVSPDNFATAHGFFNVTFSSDGQTIWATSSGGAYQWRLSDGEFVRSILGMESAGQILFSPDGNHIAMAGSPGGTEDATFIYRSSDGELIHMLQPAAAIAAVFSADSQFIITGTGLNFESPAGIIRYYRISDGGVERTINAHSDSIRWLALSPDGSILASCSSDGTAKLWNAADGSPRQTLVGHTEQLYQVRFSPDGTRVATTGFDGTIRIWNALTGAAIDTFTPLDGEAVGPFDWSPDGQSFMVANGGQFGQPIPKMREISSSDGSHIRELTRIRGQLNDMALSPDGTRIARRGSPQDLQVFAAADGSAVWSQQTGVSQDFVAFTPDSSELALGRQNGTVQFFDAATGAQGQTINAHANRVVGITFSPDGQLMATRSNNEPSKIWNFPALTVRTTFAPPFITTGGFTFAPDSDGIAVATGSGSSLFNTTDGSFIRAFIGHQQSTLDLAVSERNILLSVSIDRTARLWNIDTGATVHTLEPHENWVRAAAVSPDGQIAATGTVGDDRSLRLWDVGTGALLVRYTIDMGTGPKKIAFTPDGERIICGRHDGAVVAIKNPFAFERGDINADGVVDAFDAESLAAALVGRPIALGDSLRANVNRDGETNGQDLIDWVAILLK